MYHSNHRYLPAERGRDVSPGTWKSKCKFATLLLISVTGRRCVH